MRIFKNFTFYKKTSSAKAVHIGASTDLDMKHLDRVGTIPFHFRWVILCRYLFMKAFNILFLPCEILIKVLLLSQNLGWACLLGSQKHLSVESY